MKVALLDSEYELSNGQDTIRFIALLAEKVTWLKGQVVKIGNDTIATANKMRENGEWFRRNWNRIPAAPANSNSASAAILTAGLLGAKQATAAPLPATPPAPPPDPHKSATPTIPQGSISPDILGGAGTVAILNPSTDGPTPTDRAFWLRIYMGDATLGPGQTICEVRWGAPYITIPTPSLAYSTSGSVTIINITNVTTTGCTLSSPLPLLANTDVILMIAINPTVGDPSF